MTCDEATKTALVIMPDSQLSLAIGKSGQNVRLAARLTGWRIDIRSESQVAKAALSGKNVEDMVAEAVAVPGVDGAVPAAVEAVEAEAALADPDEAVEVEVRETVENT